MNRILRLGKLGCQRIINMSHLDLKQQCLIKIDAIKEVLEKSSSELLCHDLLRMLNNYIQKSDSNASLINNEHDQFSELSVEVYRQWFTHSNDQIAILDKRSHFININETYAKTIGYRDFQSAIGLSYDDFKCETAMQANLFRNQDIVVLNTKQPLEFLSYHRYADGEWYLLHGEKKCIFDDQKNAIGIFSKARDLTHSGLIDITRFLLKDQSTNFGRVSRKSFTYYISKIYDQFNLTPKEKEVLFYFIRGKTAQDIANIMCRAKRTIDVHIESIKFKFSVENKSHLIEKAMIEGYMTMIPQHLLGDIS